MEPAVSGLWIRGPGGEATGIPVPPARRGMAQRVVDLLTRSGPLDRRSLVAQLVVSRPVLARAVTQLLDAAVLIEDTPAPTAGHRGRPTSTLRVNPASAYTIGVHLGTRHVRGVLLDAGGSVAVRRERPRPAEGGLAAATEAVEDLVETLEQGCPGRLLGVGAALSGSVLRTGAPASPSPAVAASLAEVLAGPGGRPVVVDTEGHLAAYAEWRVGAAVGAASFVYLRLHSDVSGAMIINGEHVRGDHGRVGEFGHVATGGERSGAVCTCGQRGCLETRVSIPAVLSAVTPVLGPPVTLDGLVAAVASGEPEALAVVVAAGHEVGRFLGTLCSAVDPARCVVGGAMLRLGEPLLEAVRDGFATSVVPHRQGIPVLAASLDRFGAARGAATLVFDASFDGLLETAR